MGASQASSTQSPILIARINEKKQELDNLKELRDLSGGLAAQMQALEEKLSTLSDGTEGWRELKPYVQMRLIFLSKSCGYGPLKLAQRDASD